MRNLQFVALHVGALKALRSFGLDEPAAQALIAAAKAEGQADIEVLVPPGGGAEAGRKLVLRCKRGGHVEVYRVLDGAGQ